MPPTLVVATGCTGAGLAANGLAGAGAGVSGARLEPFGPPPDFLPNRLQPTRLRHSANQPTRARARTAGPSLGVGESRRCILMPGPRPCREKTGVPASVEIR